MIQRHDPVQHLIASVRDSSILQALASALPYLSAAEQAVARFILARPAELATMSAAQLAATTAVSEATVFRLCRQLDLPGYAALRDQVGATAAAFSDSYLTPVQVSNISEEPDILEAAVYAGIRVLLDSLAMGDPIEQAADALVNAKRVILTGVGAYTARIAEMTSFGLHRLGLTCMLWVDAYAPQVTVEMLQSDDVVVGFSHSGGNQPVARVLEMANQASATTIAITNYRFSPVACQATIPIITSFRESHIQNFDLLPRLSQLLVVQTLVSAVEARLRTEGRGGLAARA